MTPSMIARPPPFGGGRLHVRHRARRAVDARCGEPRASCGCPRTQPHGHRFQRLSARVTDRSPDHVAHNCGEPVDNRGITHRRLWTNLPVPRPRLGTTRGSTGTTCGQRPSQAVDKQWTAGGRSHTRTAQLMKLHSRKWMGVDDSGRRPHPGRHPRTAPEQAGRRLSTVSTPPMTTTNTRNHSLIFLSYLGTNPHHGALRHLPAQPAASPRVTTREPHAWDLPGLH